MKEWPLLGFTLATQLACGLTLAATVADAAPVRPLALAILPVLAAGMLLSLAHLGRPAQFWRAATNFRTSRLSLEVILTVLFALLALAYSAFWWEGRTDGRLALGAVTSLAGIAAVLAGAALYMVPAQPVWNAGWLPASFLGAALLLGGLTPALLLRWQGHEGLLRVFLGATVAGAAVLLAAAMPQRNSAWLGWHVVLASVLPAAAAIRLCLWGSLAAPIAVAVWVLVLAGLAIGRALMYVRGVTRPF